MNEKIITIAVGALLLISSIFLSYTENDRQFSLSKNYRWEAYFVEPSGPGTAFDIKNDGKNGTFSWKIESEDRTIILNGKEKIAGGEIRNMKPEIPKESLGGKIIIEITDDNNDTRDIYKILNK